MRSAFTSIIFSALPALKKSWSRQKREIDDAIDKTETQLRAEQDRGRVIAAEADRVIETLNKGNQP